MAGEKIEGGLTKAAELLQAVAKPTVAFLTWIIPPSFWIIGAAYKFYKKLPQNAAKFLVGFIFCFFGGLYPTVFAALQAAEHGGRKLLVEAVSDLADEVTVILEESKKDDTADEDKDGKADVSQISGSEFVVRKTKLVMKKMNPEKVSFCIRIFGLEKAGHKKKPIR